MHVLMIEEDVRALKLMPKCDHLVLVHAKLYSAVILAVSTMR